MFPRNAPVHARARAEQWAIHEHPCYVAWWIVLVVRQRHDFARVAPVLGPLVFN